MTAGAASRRARRVGSIQGGRPALPDSSDAGSPTDLSNRHREQARIHSHGVRFLLMLAGAVALVAAACGGSEDPGPTPAPNRSADEPSVPAVVSTAIAVPLEAPAGLSNRIAYVTPGFEIFTVSPDGSNPVRVSPDPKGAREDTDLATPGDRYLWPLWFPAGDRLLFSRIQPPDRFGSVVALVSAAADGSEREPTVVYEDDPATNGIGGGAPHYTAFSPDGKGLAAIVGTGGGILLTVFDATRPGSRGVDLVTGAPLYFDWSRDSTTLVVHQGERLITFNNVVDGEPAGSERTAPTTFFAPALSPTADRTAVILDLPAGSELRLLGQHEGFVTETPAGALFAWSPDGGRLALLRQTNPGLPFGLFDELAVIEISADGDRSERILQFGRPMRSLWWAPDSQRLALALIDEDDPRRTRWEIVDVVAGGSVHIATMVLSAESEFVQTFAGQYERSHNLWSPDSRYLVLTGSLENPAASDTDTIAPGAAGAAEVWVVAIDGITPARSLGPGLVAFWSPR